MKKFLFLALTFIVVDSALFAQWTTQTSGVTVRLRQLSVVDDNVVWCCGNDGTILFTQDGGNTWVQKTAPGTTWAIYDISALDSMTAFITGMDQDNPNAVNTKIWKTTDGGAIWIEQYNNITGFGNGIVMFDNNNGVWFGDPNPYPSSAWEILITQNGGVNWTRVPRTNYPGADSANAEYGSGGGICKYSNHVWFTGYSAENGTPNSIYHSTDKGVHWSAAPLATVSGNSISGYLAFNSELLGVFVGLDGTRAYTTDGGVTWTVATNTTPKLRFVTNVPGTDSYIAVGNSGASLISEDGGVTWTELTGAPALHLYGVDASANAAWACGNSGTIIKMKTTTDVNKNRLTVPEHFELCQNYPNPFNPTTKIKFTIPTVETPYMVSLRAYDILGDEVVTLVNEEKPAGEYEVELEGSRLSSGMYFYELRAGDFVSTKKMMLVK